MRPPRILGRADRFLRGATALAIWLVVPVCCPAESTRTVYDPAKHLEPNDSKLALGFFGSPGGRALFPQSKGGPLETLGSEPGDYRGGGGRYYRRQFSSQEFNETTDLRVVADIRVIVSEGSPASTCVQVTTPDGRTFGIGFLLEPSSPATGAVVLYADSGEKLPTLPGVYSGQDWLWRPAVLETRHLRVDTRHTYVLELLRRGPGRDDDLIRVSIPGTDVAPMTARLNSLNQRVSVSGFLFGHPVVQGAGRAEWYQISVATTGMEEPLLPRRIGNKRQLFLDDWLIEKTVNLERELGKPSKYSGNPVLSPSQPWDTNRCDMYGDAVYNPESGSLLLFYTGHREGSPATASNTTRETLLCYAESHDGGITWKKPELRVHDFHGDLPTNIVYRRDSLNVQGPFVFRDEQEKDPSRRYKLFVSDYNEGGKGTQNAAPGMDVAFSPDGIHWSGSSSNPVLPLLSDTGQSVYWDDHIHRYVAFVRLRPKHVGRSVGRTESPDFEHWSPPELVFAPTRNEYYSMGVTPYQGVYIGTPWILYNDKKDNSLPPPIMETELAFSRDGWNWSRPFQGKPFIGVGPSGSADEKQIRMSSSLVVLEDRILCFFGMSPDAHIADMRVSIGMAVLRLDGFVALKAGDAEGVLISKPLAIESPNLILNASCDEKKDGFVKVAIIDEQGRTLKPGISRPVKGDGLHIPVEWSGGGGLSAHLGKTVRLRITLRNAKLYSFQLREK